jgi:uncharacterized surface protein with fasciclin (FAS1) repeats
VFPYQRQFSDPNRTTHAAAVSNTVTAAAPANPAADLVGAGCTAPTQQVSAEPGSVEGMSHDPVAVAASNNPLPSTLTAALSGKLNPGRQPGRHAENDQYTVFAPTDEAFTSYPRRRSSR